MRLLKELIISFWSFYKIPVMAPYPSTGYLDLFRLGGNLAFGLLRRPGNFDLPTTLVPWLQTTLANRDYPDGLMLNILGRKIFLVANRDLSDRILAAVPNQHTYIAGELKQQSMQVLAPAALTISQDDQWQALRPYNERVLATDQPHPYQASFLDQVQTAFQGNITRLEDIRQRMGTAMLGIVFGANQGTQQLVADVRRLSELVENPLQRLVFGRLEARRRDRLYATLKQLWQASQPTQAPSLLAMAHAAHPPEISETVLLQQIPHWMFTFTGSGSTLLGRTLMLITALPQVFRRVQQELAEHCPAGQPQTPDTIAQLTYLEACLLETGRLYPPVILTLHRSPQGDQFQQWHIPAGIDILQVFPLLQHPRDRPLQAIDFQPERWLTVPPEARELPYSNLFLRGARTCPGKDLILFVCKGAIAHLLTHQSLVPLSDRFSRNPWPTTFPDATIQFRSQ